MGDTWSERPYVRGAVLIGDAAGHSDPIIGQGLTLTPGRATRRGCPAPGTALGPRQLRAVRARASRTDEAPPRHRRGDDEAARRLHPRRAPPPGRGIRALRGGSSGADADSRRMGRSRRAPPEAFTREA